LPLLAFLNFPKRLFGSKLFKNINAYSLFTNGCMLKKEPVKGCFLLALLFSLGWLCFHCCSFVQAPCPTNEY
jgi:hypothetical protein